MDIPVTGFSCYSGRSVQKDQFVIQGTGIIMDFTEDGPKAFYNLKHFELWEKFNFLIVWVFFKSFVKIKSTTNFTVPTTTTYVYCNLWWLNGSSSSWKCIKNIKMSQRKNRPEGFEAWTDWKPRLSSQNISSNAQIWFKLCLFESVLYWRIYCNAEWFSRNQLDGM